MRDRCAEAADQPNLTTDADRLEHLFEHLPEEDESATSEDEAGKGYARGIEPRRIRALTNDAYDNRPRFTPLRSSPYSTPALLSALSESLSRRLIQWHRSPASHALPLAGTEYLPVAEVANLQSLEQLLERLEDQAAHAEARMRRLAVSLARPPLATEPEWLQTAVSDLQGAGCVVVPTALRSASFLVRAFVARVGSPSTIPRLAEGPRGSLEIGWSPDLTWVVHPPTVGWPLVHVRVYGAVDHPARTFRLAESVLRFSEEQQA